MNKQQAINLLKNLEQSLDDYCELNDEGKTAFRMAITALNCSEFPNSSDTISRQQAIDALGGNEPVGDPSKMDDDDVVKMWERIRIINIINKLPSVQPERKTGKWAVGESVFFAGKMHHMPITCSCCGRSALNEPWKFCPNCGAKMEGGGQDEQA